MKNEKIVINISNHVVIELLSRSRASRHQIQDFQKKDQGLQSNSWKDIKAALGEDEASIEMVRFEDFYPDSGGSYSKKVHYAALIISKNTLKTPKLISFDDGHQMEKRYIKYYETSYNFSLGFALSK